VSARRVAQGTVLLASALVLHACSTGTPEPRAEAFANLPDWRGIWFAEGLEPGISGFLPGFGLDQYKLVTEDAPWNDDGRAMFLAMLANIDSAKGAGWGYPMMMNGSAPLEFVITPYETLIIETVSVRHPPRYFPYSPPLSERTRYVERIRKTGPDRIESEMTIEDPETLERPWVLNLAYKRAGGLDRLVHDAFDNDRSELDGNVFTIVPPR
jgi:hypothetical protein